ncbi:calcium-binding protein, partial [Paracidovorax avenae]|uniref:calcium-binding protein n=1 Tax=Paracidovorax avenae TaxID=80867 RepID=UPI001F45F389
MKSEVVSDISQAYTQWVGAIASGWSANAGYVVERIERGVAIQTNAVNAYVEKIGESMRSYAQKAQHYADTATNLGARSVYASAADYYAGEANKLLDRTRNAVERLNDFTSAAQQKLSNPALGGLARAFGGVVDAIQLGAALLDEGVGSDAVARVSTGIVAAEMLGAAGALAGGALAGMIGAPVVFGVGIGIFAGAALGSFYGGDIYDGLIKPLADKIPSGWWDAYFDAGGYVAGLIPKAFWDYLFSGYDNIKDAVNSLFNSSRSWAPPRDPLVLDLDGDGIEAIGIDPARPILFDHDGDGTRNATGWIKGDDGIVVLDRNGNGLIDSGRELFGDQTLREGAQAGQGMFYANGYEALAGQDGNGDGVIDAADTAYGQLRIWKDVNQDGISQAGELHTLSDLGIARLNVKGQRSSIDLGHGNTQPWSGSFTRMDGSQGMSGVAEVSGSLLLASNNFYREFPDDPVPTAAAQALPQMGGAGWVRDLREAMSLGNDKSQALQEKAQAFAAGTTRDAQMAAVDGLITEWARSSGKLVETLRFHSLYFDAATHQWDIATPDTPIDPRHLPGTEGTLSVDMPEVGTLWTDPATGQQRPLTEEDRTALYKKLNALEVFNGTRFVTFDRNVRPDSSEGSGGTPVGGSSGSGGGGSGAEADLTYRVSARLSTTQLELLAQSYEQLRESVYAALVTQTRLRPYLDSVELVVDDKGVRFDTSALSSMLEAKKGASERDGLIDLVELIEYQGPVVGAVGFDGVGLLSRWIESLPAAAPLRSELTVLRVFMAAATTGSDRNDIYLGDNGANSFSSGAGDDWLRGLEGNDHLAAGSGNDVLEGGAGDDSLQGQAGNDRLLGGEGADVLQGGDGDDVLDGGAGNDILAGGVYDTWNGNYNGAGNDTYQFGRGDGQDTIIDDDATVGNLDKLVFKTGVAVADVLAVRDGDALILKINGTTDQVRIDSYFSNDGMNSRQIEEIRFTDSATTVWKLADIKARVLTGTAGNDTIIGYATADTINGADGNDTLEGRGGNDLLEGGGGNDSLYG